MIKFQWYIFSNARVTFQFPFCPIPAGRVETQDKKGRIILPTQINIGNYWQHCEVMVFP
jgi:hypothetical protein